MEVYIVVLGGIALVPIIWQFLLEYQKKRILTFLSPENDPLGAGYHLMQSKIALGSGALWKRIYPGVSESPKFFARNTNRLHIYYVG